MDQSGGEGEQGCLAGTVGPQDNPAFAFGYLPRHPGKDEGTPSDNVHFEESHDVAHVRNDSHPERKTCARPRSHSAACGVPRGPGGGGNRCSSLMVGNLADGARRWMASWIIDPRGERPPWET